MKNIGRLYCHQACECFCLQRNRSSQSSIDDNNQTIGATLLPIK